MKEMMKRACMHASDTGEYCRIVVSLPTNDSLPIWGVLNQRSYSLIMSATSWLTLHIFKDRLSHKFESDSLCSSSVILCCILCWFSLLWRCPRLSLFVLCMMTWQEEEVTVASEDSWQYHVDFSFWRSCCVSSCFTDDSLTSFFDY